jgi:hypothetical protein
VVHPPRTSQFDAVHFARMDAVPTDSPSSAETHRTWRMHHLGVDNRLVADDELEQALAEALEADPRIRAAAIEVRVVLGVVELRGRVATAEEREEAARVAHQVSGVQAVANQLAVEPARNDTAERSSEDEQR